MNAPHVANASLLSSIGDAEKVARAAQTAIDLAVDLVGPERARALLDEAAIRRANLAADVAELAKFGAGE